VDARSVGSLSGALVQVMQALIISSMETAPWRAWKNSKRPSAKRFKALTDEWVDLAIESSNLRLKAGRKNAKK
jgi:hypothetical protein